MVVLGLQHLPNQCLSPLMLRVRLPLRAKCTILFDKVCQCLAAGRWFSPGRPVSSSNKTERRDITEILLKEALSTIKTTNQSLMIYNRVRKKSNKAGDNGGAGIA